MSTYNIIYITTRPTILALWNIMKQIYEMYIYPFMQMQVKFCICYQAETARLDATNTYWRDVSDIPVATSC